MEATHTDFKAKSTPLTYNTWDSADVAVLSANCGPSAHRVHTCCDILCTTLDSPKSRLKRTLLTVRFFEKLPCLCSFIKKKTFSQDTDFTISTKNSDFFL